MLELPFLHLCAWTLSSGRIGVTLCNDECRPHCRSCQKVTDSTIKDSYAGFFLKANWRDKFAWNQRLTVCPYHVCENSSAIAEGRELLDMPWAFNRNWLGDCTSFSTPPSPPNYGNPWPFCHIWLHRRGNTGAVLATSWHGLCPNAVPGDHFTTEASVLQQQK